MRPFLYTLFFLFVFSFAELKAQSEFSDMLSCMLESSHWKEFYCRDAQGNPELKGIITQNKIPLYTQLSFEGSAVEMIVNAPKTQRHMIVIKKVSYTPDFAQIKVLYDQRVRAKFKLGKGVDGVWFVMRSTVKQQYACEGKTKRKSFIWHF